MTDSSGKFKDYYSILGYGSREEFGTDNLKSRYRQAAKNNHPDVNNINKEAHEEAMKDVNEAYAVLGDDQLRSKYDLLYHKFLRKELIQNEVIDWFKSVEESVERYMKEYMLKTGIRLPETDVPLLEILVKFEDDQVPQRAEIMDKKGKLLWKVYSDGQAGLTIRRSTEGSSIPKGLDDYTNSLRQVAHFLNEPTDENYETFCLDSKSVIENYIKENRLRSVVEIPVGKALEITSPDRIRIFGETHEGKPPVV